MRGRLPRTSFSLFQLAIEMPHGRRVPQFLTSEPLTAVQALIQGLTTLPTERERFRSLLEELNQNALQGDLEALEFYYNASFTTVLGPDEHIFLFKQLLEIAGATANAKLLYRIYEVLMPTSYSRARIIAPNPQVGFQALIRTAQQPDLHGTAAAYTLAYIFGSELIYNFNDYRRMGNVLTSLTTSYDYFYRTAHPEVMVEGVKFFAQLGLGLANQQLTRWYAYGSETFNISANKELADYYNKAAYDRTLFETNYFKYFNLALKRTIELGACDIICGEMITFVDLIRLHSSILLSTNQSYSTCVDQHQELVFADIKRKFVRATEKTGNLHAAAFLAVTSADLHKEFPSVFCDGSDWNNYILEHATPGDPLATYAARRLCNNFNVRTLKSNQTPHYSMRDKLIRAYRLGCPESAIDLGYLALTTKNFPLALDYFDFALERRADADTTATILLNLQEFNGDRRGACIPYYYHLLAERLHRGYASFTWLNRFMGELRKLEDPVIFAKWEYIQTTIERNLPLDLIHLRIFMNEVSAKLIQFYTEEQSQALTKAASEPRFKKNKA